MSRKPLKRRRGRRALKPGRIICRRCRRIFRIAIACYWCGERLSPDDRRLGEHGRTMLALAQRREARLLPIRRALEAKARAEGWDREPDPDFGEIKLPGDPIGGIESGE